MLQSISPYALLCASKPRQPRSVTTDYDLYSLSQTGGVSSSAVTEQKSSPASDAPHHAQHTLPAAAAAKRTHYIADIHARHTSAMQRAPQSSNPL